jgi:hypothetical protein
MYVCMYCRVSVDIRRYDAMHQQPGVLVLAYHYQHPDPDPTSYIIYNIQHSLMYVCVRYPSFPLAEAEGFQGDLTPLTLTYVKLISTLILVFVFVGVCVFAFVFVFVFIIHRPCVNLYLVRTEVELALNTPNLRPSQ